MMGTNMPMKMEMPTYHRSSSGFGSADELDHAGHGAQDPLSMMGLRPKTIVTARLMAINVQR